MNKTNIFEKGIEEGIVNCCREVTSSGKIVYRFYGLIRPNTLKDFLSEVEYKSWYKYSESGFNTFIEFDRIGSSSKWIPIIKSISDNFEDCVYNETEEFDFQII